MPSIWVTSLLVVACLAIYFGPGSLRVSAQTSETQGQQPQFSNLSSATPDVPKPIRSRVLKFRMRQRFSLRPRQRSLRLRLSRRRNSLMRTGIPGRISPTLLRRTLVLPRRKRTPRLRRCLRSKHFRRAPRQSPRTRRTSLYPMSPRQFCAISGEVRDNDGRRVDGLLPTDFIVKENGWSRS